MKAQRVPLSGAHAVITGGAQGIGFATAKRLVAQSCSVTLWDLDANALEEATRSLLAIAPGNTRVRGAVCDITDRERVRAEFDAAEQETGPVDILVNNAGFLSPGDFIDQPMREWDRTIDINVMALLAVTHTIIPSMYARHRGHIVNISSAAGTIGVPGLAVYSASKWAVWGFSEALRGEARAHGVRVSSIHPSYIATGMFEGARIGGLGSLLVPRLRDHDVIARAIVEAALKRGRTSPKRPRTVRLAVLLRGILPDTWFQWTVRALGVADSMRSWTGRGDT